MLILLVSERTWSGRVKWRMYPQMILSSVNFDVNQLIIIFWSICLQKLCDKYKHRLYIPHNLGYKLLLVLRAHQPYTCISSLWWQTIQVRRRKLCSRLMEGFSSYPSTLYKHEYGRPMLEYCFLLLWLLLLLLFSLLFCLFLFYYRKTWPSFWKLVSILVSGIPNCFHQTTSCLPPRQPVRTKQKQCMLFINNTIETPCMHKTNRSGIVTSLRLDVEHCC